MNLRLTLFGLAARHGLSVGDTRRLQQLADHGAEPALLADHLPRTLAVAAAALGGFGLVLWIAANWNSFGRVGQFALLQGAIAVMGLGAWLRPQVRAPFALVAFLGIGALFAYFGQTYQTGADAWQLFALWAALGLPLCLGARSDVLWAPWALVTMTAISLWTYTHVGHHWMREERGSFNVHLASWLASGAVVLWLSGAARRWTGAGLWSLRTAITLAIMPVGLIAVMALFSSGWPVEYPLGLAVLAAGAWALSQRTMFDVYALSAVALAIDGLLIAGLTRVLFDGVGNASDPLGEMLLMTLVSVGLLTASVKWLTHLSRRHAAAGHPA